MSDHSDDKRRWRRLSPSERDEIVDLYERGEAFGPELARRFGVHRNTVFRLLKSRGAVRGSRLEDAIRRANEEINERQRQRRIAQLREDEAWLAKSNALTEPVLVFMRALLQADRDGTLAEFGREMRAQLRGA